MPFMVFHSFSGLTAHNGMICCYHKEIFDWNATSFAAFAAPGFRGTGLSNSTVFRLPYYL